MIETFKRPQTGLGHSQLLSLKMC